MRETKEILILIRENKHLYRTYSVELDSGLSGLCDIAEHLFATNIICNAELDVFKNFMAGKCKTTSPYWWKHHDPKRWEWLDEQIEKL